MINAALSNARAIAVKEQRYTGIRFQEAYDPKGPLDAAQYIIFIIHDPNLDLTLTVPPGCGFRAVPGIEPIKLPDEVGVMDLRLGSLTGEPIISTDLNISQNWQVNDTTTFSIIFSPSGKLVIHGVQVRNRDGYVDSTANSSISNDDTFNKKAQVDAGIGMFYQDDYIGNSLNSYPDLGLGEESSRNSFVIYERDKFKAAYEKKQAWSGYLQNLTPVYISPYTGTIIGQD
jgi:hypothetical protein